MKKFKGTCAAVLLALLAMPCVTAKAVSIGKGPSDAAEVGRAEYTCRPGDYTQEEEEEYNRIETTIITSTTEKEDTTTTIIDKEVLEPADIVFVIDSTGSMDPHIQNVKNNVEAFAEYLEEKNIGVRIAVMEYRDITCDGLDSTKIHMVDGTTWHKTTKELKNTLEIIKSGVYGGGDDPETLVDALGFVANGSLLFRSDAHKFAVVLTDAGYKQDNRHGLTMESVTDSLEEQDIHTSVITYSRYFDVYRSLAGSDGVIANISSSNFSEELKKLAEQMVRTIQVEETETVVTPVESVQVKSEGDSKVKVGNSIELEAVILPESAEKKTVTWNVDQEGIVSLDVSEDTRTCFVTGLKKGAVLVTAVSEDGGFTGEFKIKVIKGNAPDPEPDPWPAPDLTVDDIIVTPAKKTIAKGKSFQIKVSAELENEDISSEELEEMIENNIDGIEYRSTKSSVASVNAKTGRVSAKRKGSAVIKTTVHMADGESRTFKTKVYVRG